jgi:hypothetical protein
MDVDGGFDVSIPKNGRIKIDITKESILEVDL